MRPLLLAALLALPLANPAPVHAYSTAYGGWQCTAYDDALDIYHWLASPELQPEITITDKPVSVDHLTDSAFVYTAMPEQQYFGFAVRLSLDFVVKRNGYLVDKNWLLIDILDQSGAVLASAPMDGLLGVSFGNAEAMPIITAINTPGTTQLVVRLREASGAELARYTVPVAGFRDAGNAGAALMRGTESREYGMDCP